MFNNNKYRLGDYLVVPERCVVSRDGIDTKLELRVMQVLVCLLERAGRPVSRDELIKEVWRGGVVSDNAINRIIALLRNALGDDARSQRVIKTVPKVGYLVVAEVEPVETLVSGSKLASDNPLQWGDSIRHDDQPAAVSVTEAKSFNKSVSIGKVAAYTISGLVFALIAMTVYNQLNFKHETPIDKPIIESIANVEPLTSLDGQEVDPILSPDGSKLAFSFRPLNEEKWQVLVQDLNSGMVSHISGGESEMTDSRYPAWKDDGSQLAFLRFNGKSRCEIVLMNTQTKSSRILTTCGDILQSTTLAFRGTELLFIDATGIDDFKKIYRLDMESGHKEQLSQPYIRGRGDYGFALSPNKKQLAVLRNLGWSDTQIMLFDFETGEWRILHKVGYPLRSIAWSGGGNALVYRAEEGQLHELNLNTNEIVRKTKLFQEINSPRSNVRGQVTAVVGELVEEDIWLWVDSESENLPPAPWISSSRRDFRACISSDGTKVAFVSNRTGLPQIWMRQADGSEKKLTDFKRFAYIGELVLSNNGSMIAGTLNGSLFTLNTSEANGVVSIVKSEAMFRNVSFGRTSSEIVATEFTAEKSRIVLVDSSVGEIRSVIHTRGFSGKFDYKTGIFYFSKSHEKGLWSIEDGKEKLISELYTPYFSGAWHVADEQISFLERVADDYYLTHLSLKTGAVNKKKIAIKHLSLKTMSMSDEGKILLSVLKSANTDIVFVN